MLSSFVGCQSMGAIRSLNLAEWPSFHLRKMVQRMAIPATEAATTMSTVVIVLFFEVADKFCAATLGDAAALAGTEAVCVMVDVECNTAEVLVSSAGGVTVGRGASEVGGIEEGAGGTLTELAETGADETEMLAEALAEVLREASAAEAEEVADTDATDDESAEADAEVEAEAGAGTAPADAVFVAGLPTTFSMSPTADGSP